MDVSLFSLGLFVLQPLRTFQDMCCLGHPRKTKDLKLTYNVMAAIFSQTDHHPVWQTWHAPQ